MKKVCIFNTFGLNKRVGEVKRILSLILAVVMCLSIMPSSVLAEEESIPINEETGGDAFPEDDSSMSSDTESADITSLPYSESMDQMLVETSAADILPEAEEVSEGSKEESVYSEYDDTQNKTLDAPEFDGAASGACGDAASWTISEEGAILISGTGDMWNFGSMVTDRYVPWGKYIGSGTNIQSNPDYTPITQFVVGAGVTSIGNNALADESQLTVVTLPSGLTRIGDNAFKNCSSLKSIDFPSSILTIGSSAFWGCNGLTSVTLPASIMAIDNLAFNDCSSLKEIYFSGDAPSIGKNCFRNCTATIYYPEHNETWSDEKRQNYGGTITWEEYVPSGGGAESNERILASGSCGENIGWELTSDGYLTISGSGDMSNYRYGTSVRPWEDYFSLIREIVIEDGITSVGRGAFACDSLNAIERVTLPDSVMEIGEYAFYHCTALKEITIPQNVNRIGSFSFGDCESLQRVVFLGDPPVFESSQFSSTSQAFYGVTAKAYFPAGNDNWTDSCMQNYGGKLTWLLGDFFLIGVDNNSFIHDGKILSLDTPLEGAIGDAYPIYFSHYIKLRENISEKQASALVDKMFSNEWGGFCEGLTLSMILSNRGTLDVSTVCQDENVLCYHDIYGLIIYPDLRELINYYQLMQTAGKLKPDDMYVRGIIEKTQYSISREKYSISSWEDFWNGFFDSLKESCRHKEALLLSFDWKIKGKDKMHSVVACGIDDSNDTYTVVTLYDCNYYQLWHDAAEKDRTDNREQYIYLIVYKTANKVFLSKTNDPSGRINPYFEDSEWRYFGYYTADAINSIDIGTDAPAPWTVDGSNVSTIFETNAGATFTLRNAEGQTFSFDGTEYSGDMDLIDMEFVPFEEDSTVRYTFPASVSYTLTSFENGIEYKLLSDDSYYTAQATSADEIQFIDGRGVEISGENYTFEVGISILDTVGLMRASGSASGTGQFIHSGESNQSLRFNNVGKFTDVSVQTITEDGLKESSLDGSYSHITVDNNGVPSPGQEVPGDADGNGSVNSLDAAYILRSVVELQSTAIKYTVSDAAKILAGLE